ncbi:hypothetical protein SB01124_01534 [Klebsiella quasipneumoniae subsp. quasipneumoniae]|nr:hypothetical protein SB01124_01534 [Klebsiella quasipneumoniae subsp. quasipneumoniae]
MWMLRVFFSVILFFIINATSHAFERGVGIHPNNFKNNTEHYLELMKTLGFSSFRTDYNWSGIEKKRKQYMPSNMRLEDTLQKSFSYGFIPILILNNTNDLYGSDKPVTDEQITAFSDYAAWTAMHFKNEKVIFEIWNEWSHSDAKKKSPPNVIKLSVSQYLKLVIATSKKIKMVKPDAIVIAGGFNPYNKYEMQWARSLVSMGVMEYIDGLSVHPYNYFIKPLPTPFETIRTLTYAKEQLNKLKKNNNDIYIYVTEFGIPTYAKSRFNKSFIQKYEYSLVTLAKNTGFIKGIWWYDLFNDGNDYGNIENNFGLYDQNFHETKFMMNNINEGFIKNLP